MCEFPIPKVPQLATQGLSDDQCIELLSNYKFHVRFTFERSGFVFTHQAIENILNKEYLREAIFPNASPAIGRLDSKNIDSVLAEAILQSNKLNLNQEQIRAVSSILYLLNVISF